MGALTDFEIQLLDARVDHQSVHSYKAARAGQEALQDFQKGKRGTIDDLDDNLYYLLNHFSQLVIGQRLMTVAHDHPHEVKKRVYLEAGMEYVSERAEGEEEEPEAESAEPEEDVREEVRLVGGEAERRKVPHRQWSNQGAKANRLLGG